MKKGRPGERVGPFLNVGGGAVRLPTLGLNALGVALDHRLPSCPVQNLQYLMMHWVTSFQMFRLNADLHRFE